ncbi:MAG: glycosyltransferase family 2 protein [Bacteroidota bacterium]
MSLKFSVVTPSYNQGSFIERTIQSVLSQKGVDLEYVICDGGSSDSTLDVLRRYSDYLNWVSEADGGQADAVNKGIQATSGDIIAWINSDDIYYAEAFAKVKHIFETHPKVQVIYGNANHIDKSDHIIESYPTEHWNYTRLKDVCFISQPATFFRRNLVHQYGGLNASLNFCMDYELWLRYGRHTDFFYLAEVLAGSRLYQDTKTLGQRVAVHYEINEMLKEKFSLVPEKWVLSYISILVEERGKATGRNMALATSQVQRVHEFSYEALKSYWQWRKLRISPSSVWMMFRWTVIAYYRLIRNRFSKTLKL